MSFNVGIEIQLAKYEYVKHLYFTMSTAYALEGVSVVASFITIDEHFE